MTDKLIQEIKEKVENLVGETIYRINEYARNPIIPMKVIGIHIKQRSNSKQTLRIDCIGKHDIDESCYLEEHIGKKVFLTYEDALTALSMKVNKCARSIKDIDLTGLKLPMAAVHERPSDFPTKYVARIFDVDKPTNTVIVKDTLEEIMEDVATNTTMIFLTRGPEDVESLIGVWV